jgi:hypothetical protein
VTSPFRPQPGRPDILRHPILHCPACGTPCDAAGVTGDIAPTPTDGDYSICFRCGEVNIYVIGPFGVSIREATTAELAEFARHPDNTRTVRALHEFWATHPGPPAHGANPTDGGR